MAGMFDFSSAEDLLRQRQEDTRKNSQAIINKIGQSGTQGEKAAGSVGGLLAMMAGKAFGGPSDADKLADVMATGAASRAGRDSGVTPEVASQLAAADKASLGLLDPQMRASLLQDRANRELGVSMQELSQRPPSVDTYNEMAKLLSGAGHTEKAMDFYSRGAQLQEKIRAAGVTGTKREEEKYRNTVVSILTAGGGLTTLKEAEALAAQIMGRAPTPVPTAPTPTPTTPTTPNNGVVATGLGDTPPITGASIGITEDEPWYSKMGAVDFGLPNEVWTGIIDNTRRNAKNK